MAFTLMFSIGCKEELVMDTVVKEKPVIIDFQPKSARLGEEIVITGEFLSDVNRVYFNNDSAAVATISQLVSDNELIVKVAKQSLSGTITVQNVLGKSTSSESFLVNFPVPTIGTFVDSARTYQYIEIQGSDMDVVNEVLFGDTPGLIMETWRDVLLVRVPFYWEEKVKIKLTYNNEGAVETVASTQDFILERVEPIFENMPASINSDLTNKFVGKNLSVIDTLTLDSIPVEIISNQDTIIQFKIPEGIFDVSTEGVKIGYIYNVGFQQAEIEEPIKVVVPLIRVLEGIKLYSRSSAVDHFADFITGSIYDMCSPWTLLQPNISMLAYASKTGFIQFRSPHNCNTVIKNYKCGWTDEGALPQENGNRYCLMRRLQADDPDNGALHAKYIEMVRNNSMELDVPEFIAELNSDVTTINPGSSSLNFYNDEELSNLDPQVQPQLDIDDVVAIKHVDVVDGKYLVSYGFIHLTDAFADVNGEIGALADDDSFLQFDVYIVKEQTEP
jgi:hypothetical protein